MTATTAATSDWRTRAACRDTDPDLFFPVGTAGPAIAQVARAKQVCESCPARAACLDWAIEHHEKDGIWGGLEEAERHRERRLRQRRRREYAA